MRGGHNFDRENYLTCTDLARLSGYSYSYCRRKLEFMKLYPDKAWGANRYWKKEREQELLNALMGNTGKMEQGTKKSIRIDESFFDFDPIPEYFRRIEDDEV